jgi:hypothetical protein
MGFWDINSGPSSAPLVLPMPPGDPLIYVNPAVSFHALNCFL